MTIRVAIVLWGICRCESNHCCEIFKQNIVLPLTRAGFHLTIFQHTYTHNGIEHPSNFGAHVKQVEAREEVLQHLPLETYSTCGVPWDGSKVFLTNHLLALWSQNELHKMMSDSIVDFDVVVGYRPDTAACSEISPAWIVDVYNRHVDIYTPNFHKYPVNDRFFIANKKLASIYLSRFQNAEEYTKKKQLHSETFLSDIYAFNSIQPTEIPYIVKRCRGPNYVGGQDLQLCDAPNVFYEKFLQHCANPCDINEHLSTLYGYAIKCNHITECGVRNVVSSWPFVAALSINQNGVFRHIDIVSNSNITKFQDLCKEKKLKSEFVLGSTLDVELNATDLLFIDTWHVYGQLKRELHRWAPLTRKWIIMHDTTIFGDVSEIVKLRKDMNKFIGKHDFTLRDMSLGLWPAVEEFLITNPEWVLEYRFTNNNGLTILRRK